MKKRPAVSARTDASVSDAESSQAPSWADHPCHPMALLTTLQKLGADDAESWLTHMPTRRLLEYCNDLNIPTSSNMKKKENDESESCDESDESGDEAHESGDESDEFDESGDENSSSLFTCFFFFRPPTSLSRLRGVMD